MAKVVNAVDVVITLKRPGDTDETIVGCAQSFAFTKTRTMDPATCSASGKYAQFSPGQMNATGNITALYREPEDEDEEGIFFDDIDDMLEDGTEVTVSFAKTVGGKRYEGPALISELTYTRPETGSVTWNANLQFNGKIAKVTRALSAANLAIINADE